MPAQAIGAQAKCVDLTCEVCPVIFMKAKFHLDQLAPGEALELALKEGEALREMPRSLKDEGHRIERVRREGDTVFLLVRRGGAPAAPEGRGLAAACAEGACCCSCEDSDEGEETDAR